MEKFKNFWVKSVNNWTTDASYSGKELKERNPFPSFRRFHFIRSWDELNHFTPHDSISNEELVKQRLATPANTPTT